MDKDTETASEVFEGTWDELAQLAPKFNGQRLRLQVMLQPQTASPFIRPKPGAYAEYVRRQLASSPPMTADETLAEEHDLKEVLASMNETRRFGGADPIYSPFIRPKIQCNYAKQVLEELSALPAMTPAEAVEAEEEQLELKRNLNENRRRDGAEILFLDV